MSIVTRLIEKIKQRIARPKPARKGNTPWRGRKPRPQPTRSILWTLPDGQTRILVMA